MPIKAYISVSFMIFLGMAVHAQGQKESKVDTLWESTGLLSLNIGQTSFTNWAAGGENQVNINAILNYRLQYRKDKSSWENNIEASYGSLIFSDLSAKKTDDKLNLASKYGYQASKFWSYSYYLSLNTQFTNGYNYPNDSVIVSTFMAPGYLMAGLGMDYQPNKSLSVLMSPLTYKVTIVNNEFLSANGSYGIDKPQLDTAGSILHPSKRFKNQPGAFVKVYYQHEFDKGLSISSKLELFTAFSDNPLRIDLNWSNFFSYKISKLFSATFTLDLVYDYDTIIKVDSNGDGVKEEVGRRLQAKQTFGIGLAMSL